MSTKTKLLYLAMACLLAVIVVGMVACGEATEETTTSAAADTTTTAAAQTTTSAAADTTTTAASSVDLGGIKMAINAAGARTDGAWNECMYNAYVTLHEKYPDLDLVFGDDVPFNDRPAFISQQAGDLDLMYAASSFFAAIQAVAGDFPDTWFAVPELTQGDLDVMPANVTTYTWDYAEPLYMAGVAAGLETKTNVVAAVLGMVGYPDLNSSAYAFFEGAKSVNPNVKFVVGVTGDFNDIQKGYDQAMAVIDAGADVIMHFADNGGKGVIKAATERNVLVIGEALDQSNLAPENVMTSYLVPHDYMAEQALLDLAAGKMSKGIRAFSIRDGLPALAPLTNVSEETKAKVEEIKQAILDGSLVVTPNYDAKNLDEFVLESK